MSTIIVFNTLSDERRLSLTVSEPLDDVATGLRSGWATLTTASGPVLVNASNIAFVQEAATRTAPLAQAATY
ncbi:MAG TPA: hypothetical protein VL120_04055 [Solirubrobacteraceae bacterium]|jgi:hypothetical protein|nr:hypothetical protein [Solirubrobacteraceae bacterium]